MRKYFLYRFFNSFFGGVSIAGVFVFYAQISSKIITAGGLFVAIFAYVAAHFYIKIMKFWVFHVVIIICELLMLTAILWYVVFDIGFLSAFNVFVALHVSFAFAPFLGRFETIWLRKNRLLMISDKAKQKGYILGLFCSFLFFHVAELIGVNNKQNQVYYLHVALVFLQFYIFVLSLRIKNKISKK